MYYTEHKTDAKKFQQENQNIKAKEKKFVNKN